MKGPTRIVEPALVILGAIAFALSFGWNFAIGGHTCYLPLSLRLADPELFARDWYLNDTTQYHPAFGQLGRLLFGISSSGWAFGIAQTVTVAVAATSLYFLARLLVPRNLALASYFALLAFGFVTRWRGPGTTYVFDGVFQPSGVSSAFLLLAFPLFVGGRFLASGALLGLAGLFHVNVLVLGCGAFGCAHLLLGKEQLVRRLALQFALPALVLALFLPMVLRASGAPAGFEAAQHVFTHSRNAHHFLLGRQWTLFLPYVGWELVACAALVPLLYRGGVREGRLAALAAGFAVVVWGGIVGMALNDRLSLLFVWRVLPHGELLLHVGTLTSALRVIAEPELAARWGKPWRALLLVGCVVLIVAYGVQQHAAALELILVVAAGVVVAARLGARGTAVGLPPWLERRVVPWRERGPRALTAVALAGVAFFGVGPVKRMPQHSTLLVPRPADESALYAWMRTATPKSTLFLTPPDMEAFRLLSERAIVVDFKGVPAIPHELVEWHRRLRDVSGRPDLMTLEELAGYDAMDPARLEALRARYHFEYVVVRRGTERRLPGYPHAYENASFLVLGSTPRGS